MEHLFTNQTASVTELRDLAKLTKSCGNKPVAIMNRNQLEGYYVPSAAINTQKFELAQNGEVLEALNKRRAKMQPVMDYLKDK